MSFFQYSLSIKTFQFLSHFSSKELGKGYIRSSCIISNKCMQIHNCLKIKSEKYCEEKIECTREDLFGNVEFGELKKPQRIFLGQFLSLKTMLGMKGVNKSGSCLHESR